MKRSTIRFVAGIENQGRREDAEILLEIMERITGCDPVMWGDSMVGIGRYHYKYASGREGDYSLTGFSPRKAAMSVYIMPGFKQYAEQLQRLGKHRHGVLCLYRGRLAGIDLNVLEEMVEYSVRRMKAMYPG